MRYAGGTAYDLWTRALIVTFWRAGLRISEALALAQRDLGTSEADASPCCLSGPMCVVSDQWPQDAH